MTTFATLAHFIRLPLAWAGLLAVFGLKVLRASSSSLEQVGPLRLKNL